MGVGITPKNKHIAFSSILQSEAYPLNNYDLLQMANCVSLKLLLTLKEVSDFFSLILSKIDQSKLNYHQLIECNDLGIETESIDLSGLVPRIFVKP